jgi:amidase
VRLDQEIRAAVHRLGGVLRELGHTVIEDEPRYGLMGVTLLARGESGVHEWVAAVPDRSLLHSSTRSSASAGRWLGRPLLGLARRLEPFFQRTAGAIFQRADVVLAPTTAAPPFAVGAHHSLSSWGTDQMVAGACPYAWPWNVLGWPGVNVPAGVNRDGLPFGVQLLGPANTEGRLLSLAAQLERVERWHERVAPTFASALGLH